MKREFDLKNIPKKLVCSCVNCINHYRRDENKCKLCTRNYKIQKRTIMIDAVKYYRRYNDFGYEGFFSKYHNENVIFIEEDEFKV